MERNNPLLTPSGAPFGAPPFDLIRKADYLPAFEQAIRLAREEVEAIAADSRPPTFSNTVEALEYSGAALSRVEQIFFNLLEADTDDEMQELAEKISPKLTDLSTFISLNRPLFERIRTVYDNRAGLTLERDQERLLEDTYKGFARSGALLPEEGRKRYAVLVEELQLLELAFGNNVLAATNAFQLHLTDASRLEGLPEYVREAGAQAASEKGLDGWLFTLQAPSYGPFMKFSACRDLRERMWMAYNSRALDTNAPLILQITAKRTELAQLLGFPTYADYALENRMAKSRRTVEAFLDRLMRPSLPVARKEVAEITEFARRNGFPEPVLQPWDFSYWSERYRQEHFAVNEELLKPYFRLESTIDAVLGLANRLYGIRFEERKDIPAYHPDVKVYAVKDERGRHLALFYADFFPRESKRGGAWMTEFRGQYTDRGGEDVRPFISIVMNFSKPAGGKPALLTHGEVETFLHEFGHSLHGMLSRGRYPSQCGTNVARDFVELPSQIMENWAYEPEWLDTFARHYETGETIPREYIARIVAARNYLAGYAQVRQLQFGLVDMAWHTLSATLSAGDTAHEDAASCDAAKATAGETTDAAAVVEQFEKQVLAPFLTLPAIPGTATCPSFGHIFSGGYSAGYYSYKWAEVLEADAFESFRERGVFDRATAESFRKNILERGSSEDEQILYRNFRGHDPEPEALLKKLEII